MITASIVLVGIVLVSTALWVAVDSEKYDWAKWEHPTHPEWHCAAESFSTWFFVCLLLWPVFFPGYFVDRKYAPYRVAVRLVQPRAPVAMSHGSIRRRG